MEQRLLNYYLGTVLLMYHVTKLYFDLAFD